MQLSGLSLIKAKHNLKMFVINCSEYELLSFIKVNTFVIEYSKLGALLSINSYDISFSFFWSYLGYIFL